MYAKDKLIAALQLRYDSHSAGAVLEIACKRAGLADKPTYDAAELRAIRDAIEATRDRVGRVVDALDELLGAAPKNTAAEATKATPETADVAAKTSDIAPETSDVAPESSDAPPEGPIETTVVLAGLETDEGEHVLLCGASELLGDWDPERAQPMVRDGEHWVAQIKMTPGTEHAFKFVIRAADGEVTWEPGNDRKLVAKPRLEVTWR